MIEHLINLGGMLGFNQESRSSIFGDGKRVVVLGQESVEIKKTGATIPRSEYATILDIRDGQIVRFLVIQDLSAFAEAYRDG